MKAQSGRAKRGYATTWSRLVGTCTWRSVPPVGSRKFVQRGYMKRHMSAEMMSKNNALSFMFEEKHEITVGKH